MTKIQIVLPFSFFYAWLNLSHFHWYNFAIYRIMMESYNNFRFAFPLLQVRYFWAFYNTIMEHHLHNSGSGTPTQPPFLYYPFLTPPPFLPPMLTSGTDVCTTQSTLSPGLLTTPLRVGVPSTSNLQVKLTAIQYAIWMDIRYGETEIGHHILQTRVLFLILHDLKNPINENLDFTNDSSC